MTLADMAKTVGVSAAFLSAIETGRKRIPDSILEALAENFHQVQQDRDKYEVLINQARSEVRLALDDSNFEDAKLATALARKFGSMTAEEKDQLRNFLKE